MKTHFKNLLLIGLLLLAMPIYSMVLQDVPDVTDPASLVVLLMPAIVWAAVEGAKVIKNALGGSIAGGWLLGLIVPGLSALLAWVLTLIDSNASFVAAFLLGLASTFIDQLITKVKGI